MSKRIGYASIFILLGLIVTAFAAGHLVAPTSISQSTVPVSHRLSTGTANVAATSMPKAEASYMGFSTIASMTHSADTIAKGKVVAEHRQHLNISEGVDRVANPTYVDCVVVDFRVLRAVKGAVRKNEIIPIAYLAGEDVPGLKNNASSIVFLVSTEAGPYMPVNPGQGVIRIENGKVRADGNGLLVEPGTDEEDVVEQIAR